MKKWYYIIQGRTDYDGWTQLQKGKVEAVDKKEARKIVEDLYNKESIPMRIKREDVSKDSILLSVYEIKGGHFTEDFFIEKECIVCKNKYKLIDKFNIFGSFGGYEFCSYPCEETHKNENYVNNRDWNSTLPVIYMITQLSTGKSYIGKTIRSFTLRWWEHIKTTDTKKFSIIIENITDYQFKVIEVLDSKISDADILKKEKGWIDHYNTIDNGFNTIGITTDTMSVIE